MPRDPEVARRSRRPTRRRSARGPVRSAAANGTTKNALRAFEKAPPLCTSARQSRRRSSAGSARSSHAGRAGPVSHSARRAARACPAPRPRRRRGCPANAPLVLVGVVERRPRRRSRRGGSPRAGSRRRAHGTPGATDGRHSRMPRRIASATAAARSDTPSFPYRVRHVRLDGRHRDDELAAIGRGGQPLGDQGEDLRLARGQARGSCPARGRGSRRGRPACSCGSSTRLAAGRRDHRVADLLAVGVLGQVAAPRPPGCPRTRRSPRSTRRAAGRAWAEPSRASASTTWMPSSPGILTSSTATSGREPADALERRPPVGGLSTSSKSSRSWMRARDALPEQRVIVGDQDSDGRHRGRLSQPRRPTHPIG